MRLLRWLRRLFRRPPATVATPPPTLPPTGRTEGRADRALAEAEVRIAQAATVVRAADRARGRDAAAALLRERIYAGERRQEGR